MALEEGTPVLVHYPLTSGRKAKLTDAQARALVEMYNAKTKSVTEIGEIFGISRESVYTYVRKAA